MIDVETLKEQADRLLISGQFYQWRKHLLKAIRTDEHWSLLCYDRQTGRGVPYEPGALFAFGLTSDGWTEYFALSFDNSDMPRRGAVVELDPAQLQPVDAVVVQPTPQAPAPSELLDGHIYSQFVGLNWFVARKSPDGGASWLLQRIDEETGQVFAAKEGDLVGILVDDEGNWWQLNHQAPEVNNGRPEFQRLWSREQLKYFQHEADSIEDHSVNRDFRGLMLGKDS